MSAEEYDALPPEVRAVLDRYVTYNNSYLACEEIKAALNEIGWDCDYGLDAEIYDVKELA